MILNTVATFEKSITRYAVVFKTHHQFCSLNFRPERIRTSYLILQKANLRLPRIQMVTGVIWMQIHLILNSEATDISF